MADNKSISDRVVDMLEAWTSVFKKKNRNYGDSWLLTGQTLKL